MRSVRRRFLSGLVMLVGLGAAGGCYTHVTDAKGIGSSARHPERHESHEPLIDKWIDNAKDKR